MITKRDPASIWRPVGMQRVLNAYLSQVEESWKNAQTSLDQKKKEGAREMSAERVAERQSRFDKRIAEIDARNWKPENKAYEKRRVRAEFDRAEERFRPIGDMPDAKRKDGRWYWGPHDAKEQLEQRLASLTEPQKREPACFREAPVELDFQFTQVQPAGTAACETLVEFNPDSLRRDLPRTALQLLLIINYGACREKSRALLKKNPVMPGGCVANMRLLEGADWSKITELLDR